MKKTSSILSLAAAAALGAGSLAGAAAPAQAASGTVWDRVAACESSGNWSINTGNGFYGGLQFTHSTWIAFGGGKYANNAHQATKAQQIEIAKKVLVGQGPGAWPVCSRRAGLTRANGLAVSTGATTPARPAAKKPVATKPAVRKPVAKPATPAKGARYVTVKRGDSLSLIAARQGTTWQKLWQLNRSTISNPNVIKVGQKIRVA